MITFTVDGRPAGVAAFGAVFIDADWPGEGPALAPASGPGRLEGVRIGVYRSYYGAGQRPRTEAVFERRRGTERRGYGSFLHPPSVPTQGRSA